MIGVLSAGNGFNRCRCNCKRRCSLLCSQSGVVDVYFVKGESEAPAGEEQRAPANGWCDLGRHDE